MRASVVEEERRHWTMLGQMASLELLQARVWPGCGPQARKLRLQHGAWGCVSGLKGGGALGTSQRAGVGRRGSLQGLWHVDTVVTPTLQNWNNHAIIAHDAVVPILNNPRLSSHARTHTEAAHAHMPMSLPLPTLSCTPVCLYACMPCSWGPEPQEECPHSSPPAMPNPSRHSTSHLTSASARTRSTPLHLPEQNPTPPTLLLQLPVPCLGTGTAFPAGRP